MEKSTKISAMIDEYEQIKNVNNVHNVASQGDIHQDEDENGTIKFACVVDIQKPINFEELVPNPVLEYDFELDTFQKQAIILMEGNSNVFVAAHTSAGKTVVAEYAIALALNNMTKAIYTSPIKALSNQKFRDFKQTFEDVGLVTGDVQVRPESNVLVMTTEILRSMLYNGSDVLRDLEWVIFDEIHYINDSERGVVWEEVLILLPAHVKIVMLSATVPNPEEFAEWVGRIKKKKVYVISTPKRPVPLQHFLYTGNSSRTSNELFLILDQNKNFVIDGHRKAVEAMSSRTNRVDQKYGSRNPRYNVNPKKEQQIWSSLILQLEKNEKLPAVAFAFSKHRIDVNTSNLNNLDLLNSSEKSQVIVFFDNSINVLNEADRELPQVKTLKELLQRGIGVHHSGILPILKEIVEMLFQRGLVKVLFATDTFAMGVNMPARTVIFDSIRKHDKEGFRNLLPGEYIQMAGRAGRRGLDDTGTVIILCKNDVPETSDLHGVMMGMPMVLKSQFRITYSMVLKLLRMEQFRIEDMMRRSFVEFNTERHSDKKLARINELTENLEEEEEQSKGLCFSSVSLRMADLSDYYKVCEEYYLLKDKIIDLMLKHDQIEKCMTPGRLVVLEKLGGVRNVPGVVLGPAYAKDKIFNVFINADDFIMTKSNEKCVDDSDDDIKPKPYMGINLYKVEGSTTPKMVEAQFKDFIFISSQMLKMNADQIVEDFRKRKMPWFKNDPPSQNTIATGHDLLRLLDSCSDLPELDPVNDLEIQETDIVETSLRMNFLKFNVKDKYKCLGDALFKERFKRHRKRMMMEEEINKIKHELSDESLIFLPEYQNRVKVLSELGHISKTNGVTMKGRVSCELGDQELLITELIFENLITDLEPEVIAAILSCVVFEQKRCSEPRLNTKLNEVYSKFKIIADNLTAVQKRFQVMEDDVIEQCNNGLMEVVYEWAKGVPFVKLTELTDVQEGVIVKCIQRLNELFHLISKAAKIIGSPELEKKMEEASKLIKRDIVFTGSLYLE